MILLCGKNEYKGEVLKSYLCSIRGSTISLYIPCIHAEPAPQRGCFIRILFSSRKSVVGINGNPLGRLARLVATLQLYSKAKT